jgi:peptidyl-prolyl cis-trans isomerase D
VDKKYEDVRETIRAQLAKGKSMEKAIEAANGFEDARAGGASMADAAAKGGLDSVHIAAVDKNGLAPDGAKANLPADAKLLQQAFAAEAGEEGDIFQTDDEHSYAVKVVGVRPPAPRPLDQVRDQVVNEWSEAERAKQLAARVRSLTEEARKNGNLNAVAAAAGRAPTASQPMRRDQANETFALPVLADLFNTPPGSVVYGPLGKGAGYVIARSTAVANLDPQKDPGAYDNTRRQAGQQLAGDLIQSLAMSARASAGTTINDKAYNRAVGGSQ